jgi:hypothetical protein
MGVRAVEASTGFQTPTMGTVPSFPGSLLFPLEVRRPKLALGGGHGPTRLRVGPFAKRRCPGAWRPAHL